MERQKFSSTNINEGINNNQLSEVVKGRIEKLGIRPNENLGQQFLVDKASIDLLAQSVSPGNTVIEIGAGVGQLTEALAGKAAKVITVEIDKRYESVLTEVTQKNPNVQIIFGDAIALLEGLIPKRKKNDEVEVQIVANLPFHITEPFLHKIAGLPIENATLVVGQRLTHTIQAPNEESSAFGQMTLLAQTFFDTDVLATVEKQKSFPSPRTDLAIIRLTPKEEYEFRSNRREFLLRRLFLTARRSPLVKNALKEGIIEFAQASDMGTLSKKEHIRRLRRTVKADLRRITGDYNHFGTAHPEPQKPKRTGERLLTQSQARALIEKMEVPDSVLDKPFQQLNNSELGVLSKKLRLLVN